VISDRLCSLANGNDGGNDHGRHARADCDRLFSEGMIASMPREVGFAREALSQKHRKAVV
jgi:hypothetical protein